jgi:uncharacterized protein
MIFLKEESQGILLKIKVQPRASKNEISGVLGDALKIRITAPPVDGEANECVISFLAKLFKVAKQDIEITTGHTGRNKSVFIWGITAQQFKKITNL